MHLTAYRISDAVVKAWDLRERAPRFNTVHGLLLHINVLFLMVFCVCYKDFIGQTFKFFFIRQVLSFYFAIFNIAIIYFKEFLYHFKSHLSLSRLPGPMSLDMLAVSRMNDSGKVQLSFYRRHNNKDLIMIKT